MASRRLFYRRPGVWGVVFLSTLCASAAFGDIVPGQTIGKITIEADDIFDLTNPSENKWFYRTANVLHIQTRKSVIRRELLFKEGDPYNPDLVAESERNIRRFGFLRRVRITPQGTPDGKVDLTVHTKDTWTLEPQLDFSRVGNKSSMKFGVVERNLLGTGQRLSVFHHQLPEGDHNSFAYRDQQFLGRALDFNAEYLNGTDFREYGASISKPFRSTQSRTSFELSDYFSEETIIAYQDGDEVGRYEKESRAAGFSVGRAFHSSTKQTNQGRIGVRQDARSYLPLSGDTSGFLKTPLELTVIEAGYSWQQIDFVKERHIEKFDRDEDFNLGAGASGGLGVGQNWKDNNRLEILPSFSAHTGIPFSPGHFALASMSYRSRIARDRTDNLLVRMDIQYFNRLRANNTLASHLAYDHGYRLDPEDRLLLGEDTGLRGYSIGQFSGDRRVLFNLEDRVFFAEDVLHLMSFGGAVFFDSGAAWGSSQAMRLGLLRSSIGVGFRIAMSRSSRNEPVRFDLAYALNDNDQNSRLVFSIQSGVKFGGEAEKRSRL